MVDLPHVRMGSFTIKLVLAVIFLIVMTAIYASVFSTAIFDFSAFYVGGQIFAHGDAHRLYDLRTQYDYQSRYLPATGGPFISPRLYLRCLDGSVHTATSRLT